MIEESKESYRYLFRSLKERGMEKPCLILSDAYTGLVSAIGESFPGSSWQRCKVHFMRNILVHFPHREKKALASQLKLIWQASSAKEAKQLANVLVKKYGQRFPQVVAILENGLEDSLAFYAFPSLDSRKVSSNKPMERLNFEIRRRSRVVGIFSHPKAYPKLVTIYLIEYSEDWSTATAYLSKAYWPPFRKPRKL